MSKSVIAIVAGLGLVAAGALVVHPALRAKVARSYQRVTGWDEAARQADPVGFVQYAEHKLRQDLAAMQKTRRELAGEVGALASKQREQQDLADQAQRLAEEFRDAYQAAESTNGFPLVVRNAAYTRAQVHSQVSMLLAESEGYQQSLANVESVQADAEHRLEELAVRINATESQLASLGTKRELLRARELTTQGQELLTQVDDLLNGNTEMLTGNPVRTVRELVNAQQVKPTGHVPDQRVAQFLATVSVSKPQIPDHKRQVPGEASDPTEVDDVPVSIIQHLESSPERPKRAHRPAKQRGATSGKPIFQQS